MIAEYTNRDRADLPTHVLQPRRGGLGSSFMAMAGGGGGGGGALHPPFSTPAQHDLDVGNSAHLERRSIVIGGISGATTLNPCNTEGNIRSHPCLQ